MSSPEYFGLVLVLKIDMIDRWENPKYLVFFSIMDSYSAFQSTNPVSSVFSTNKIKKSEFF